MSRKLTLLIVALTATSLLFSTLATPASARDSPRPSLQDSIEAACGFLENLYNPSIGLIRTTPNSSIYYIASDNLLAQHALLDCHNKAADTVSNKITQTFSKCCSNGDDLMHEALLGDKIPLPIHTANRLTIANSSLGTVYWEVHNKTDVLPDCTYGDVTVYTALEYGSWYANATGLQHEMRCLNLMFDGKGIADKPFTDGDPSEHGIYQTYKLALYIYAQNKFTDNYVKEDLNRLLGLQGSNGGFYTGYDPAGTTANTKENTETTSIAMITLNSITPPCHSPHQPHSTNSASNHDHSQEGNCSLSDRSETNLEPAASPPTAARRAESRIYLVYSLYTETHWALYR